MLTRRNQQLGFTLVEMIMVMVITGIIGGMVAIFIQAPVQGYINSENRAELTDIADTAMRRMARDVRTAVPNSVRITGCVAGNPCVEFIPTKDGGRYRIATPGNALTFGTGGSNTFDIIGTQISFAAGDYIVIGNTQSSGAAAYDVSLNGVLRKFTGTAGSQPTVTFTNTVLPAWAALASQRFDVVDGAQQAVTYACETDPSAAAGDGTLRLMRHWLYWTGAGTPYASYSSGGTSAILATKVSACTIGYVAANQRYGLLTVLLTMMSNNESISLYSEIHVNNAP